MVYGLQCKEEVFKAIAQKALNLKAKVTLTSKFRESEIVETLDDEGKKVKKIIKRSTGYRELGQDGWYLVYIEKDLYKELTSNINLGPHILVQLETRTVDSVDYNHEYIYFRVNDNNIIEVAHCFTQNFIITKKRR